MAEAKFEDIRHEYLKLEQLEVHPRVQRGLRLWFVKELQTEFDPDKFGELSVIAGPRKVKYYVFDGQHRMLAARAALGDNQRVPCAIYEDATEQELAKIFLGHNARVAPNSLDKWPIRIMAGDQEATAIERILTKRQLYIGKSRSTGAVQAVAALEKVYSRYSPEVLERTLDVILTAWGKDPDAFDGTIVRAIGLVFGTSNGVLDPTDLAKKLAKAGVPTRLMGQARDLSKFSGVSVERAFAERVVNIYNRHRHQPTVELPTTTKRK